MKRLLFPGFILCLLCAPALAQESLDEVVEKLSKADRATAMKMFPELEKRLLVAFEEEVVLVEGKPQKAELFRFYFGASDRVKEFYYCYKLKTGELKARKLAALRLRPQPMRIAETLEELLTAGDTENFDKTAESLSSFAQIGPHEDSPSGFALYWDVEDRTAYYLLERRMHALYATAPAAFSGESDQARRIMLRSNVLLSRSQKNTSEFLKVLNSRLAGAKDENVKSDIKLCLAFAQEMLDDLVGILFDEKADTCSVESALAFLQVADNPVVIEKLREALRKNADPRKTELVLAALNRAIMEHHSREKRCDFTIDVILSSKDPEAVRLWALQQFGWLADWEAAKKLIRGIDRIEDDRMLEGVLSRLSWVSHRLSPEHMADMAIAVHKKLGTRVEEWVLNFVLSKACRKLAQRLYDMSKEEKDKDKKALYESLALEVTKRYQAVERGEHPGPGTESMVNVSLRWLHFHQDRPGGKWDSDGFNRNCSPNQGPPCTTAGAADLDIPSSALSLLAFLGNGHTHRVGQFKKTVKLGFDWLLSLQNEEGCFSQSESKGEIEKHALATMAVCELYAITRDTKALEPARRAIRYLLERQEKSGGWKKGKNAPEANVLTTAWCVLALKAAKLAKLDIPQESFDRALKFFDSWSFQPQRAKAGFLDVRRLHGIAAIYISSIFCGRSRRDEKMVKLADILDQNPPRWDDGNGSVYWYFATYSMFQCGGKKWLKWHEPLKKTLINNQQMGGCADGSWNPVGPEAGWLGRAGATALNTLSMEIYYRYMRSSELLKQDKDK